MPVIFFWGFGLNKGYVHQRAGHGNVSAVEMISIALYGAVAATATCGAMVSIERVAGWSRQLRVTPLSPVAYVVIKMLTSLVLAAGAVCAVYLVGAVTNKVSMPADLWVITGFCVWIGSLLFAAFGLFTGYLLPSENVTQVIGLALTLGPSPAACSSRSASSPQIFRPSPSSRRCTGSASLSTTRWPAAPCNGPGS
jgi:ABC-2 type transport system permease protein